MITATTAPKNVRMLRYVSVLLVVIYCLTFLAFNNMIHCDKIWNLRGN
jgi:hypothetical protein